MKTKKRRLSRRGESSPKFIKIEKEIIQQIIKYCEDQAIYDKLGKYGDFYYKLKKEITNENKKSYNYWF